MSDDYEHIPDPIELMESRIECEIDKVTSDGKYPCANCGDLFDVEEGICVSPMGDGPLVCSFKCAYATLDRGKCDEEKRVRRNGYRGWISRHECFDWV